MEKTLRDQLDRYRLELQNRLTAVELLLEVESPQLELPFKKPKTAAKIAERDDLGKDRRGRRRVTHRNGHRTWVMKVKDYAVKNPDKQFTADELLGIIGTKEGYKGSAIRNAVLRLWKDGFLKRVERGVYTKRV